MGLKLPKHADVVSAAARIAGRVETTPVFRSTVLDEIAGASLLIKAECLQQTGSFKLRGATHALNRLDAKARAAGVVAASTGNHGRGLAHAARAAGVASVLVTFGPGASAGQADIRALMPDALLDHFDDLPDLIENILPRKINAT